MNSELQKEQERLDNVVKEIKGQISRLEKETTQHRKEVIHTRKHFWDEIKVNVDTFDDYLETIIGLRQEAQALSVSESTHRQASKRLAVLRRMVDTPYFGRIDFIEEGNSTMEQIYIGISTVTDSTGEHFLVYDWRAPISSVYYDFMPGPAKYTTPEGIIYGKLDKKWQYIIRGGVLHALFDTNLTIGDEILQEILGQGVDKHMHNIVATIQQDQNEIIRYDRGKMLIVHGAAGSGKTSAALQRIAYLLYKYRDRLNADQIILFSPNSIFNSYVSNVLPELGEENMQQVTFQDYLDHRLSKEFQLETPFDQLEYVLTAEKTPAYKARIASIQFKASVQFFTVIHSYWKSLETSGMIFKDITFRGQPIVTAQQITDQFYQNDPSLRFHSRLEKLKEWLLKKVKEAQKMEWKKEWVQEEIELLSNAEYHKIRTFLGKKRGFNEDTLADYEPDRKILAKFIVNQKMKPIRKQIRSFHFIDFKRIYKQLFLEPNVIKNYMEEAPPADWHDICKSTIAKLNENKLSYEDATPFLLLKELILDFQTNHSIKHIVIDEAQDYSPFQFEFLKRLFPRAKMTVLGDFNQAIFAHASETVDFQQLIELFGLDETAVFNLVRSYRSTKPIIEFTRRLIPGSENIIPFHRDGELPVLTKVSDHNELHHRITTLVADLRKKEYKSIAIICKSASESYKAYQTLSHIDQIKLLKSSSMEFEQGVVIVPSYLSKGIEFDAVIVYNASKQMYGEENMRRVFYTVCTRAMHHLQLFSVGEPSPFLQNALEEGLIRTKE